MGWCYWLCGGSALVGVGMPWLLFDIRRRMIALGTVTTVPQATIDRLHSRSEPKHKLRHRAAGVARCRDLTVTRRAFCAVPRSGCS